MEYSNGLHQDIEDEKLVKIDISYTAIGLKKEEIRKNTEVQMKYKIAKPGHCQHHVQWRCSEKHQIQPHPTEWLAQRRWHATMLRGINGKLKTKRPSCAYIFWRGTMIVEWSKGRKGRRRALSAYENVYWHLCPQFCRLAATITKEGRAEQ